MDEPECAGHLEVHEGPNGEREFRLRGLPLLPGTQIEVLFGLEEWGRGEFVLDREGTPHIRMKDICVRIRLFAFVRLAHADCN